MDLQRYLSNDSNGVSQGDRLPRELKADYLKLDSRTYDDLLKQMALWGENVKFYDDSNKNTQYNWAQFFTEIFDGLSPEGPADSSDTPERKVSLKKNLLQKMMKEGTVPPHLALILTFLKFYQVQQKNFNEITERHLQFFYQDVLGFKPKKGVVGKAMVFMEIAKGQDSLCIPKGTLFNAGKDASGKPITYASSDELVLNGAKVKTFAEYRVNNSGEMVVNPCRFSENPTGSTLPALPVGYGFAISSPQFNVEEEGVNVKIQSPSLSAFDVYITCWSGWKKVEEGKGIASNEICSYDKKVHGEGFDTKDPVVRFVAKNLKEVEEYASWPSLSVLVEKSRNLLIENAYGTFPNKVGVLPYGPMYEKNEQYKYSLKAVLKNGEITGGRSDAEPSYTPENTFDPQHIAKQLIEKKSIGKGYDATPFALKKPLARDVTIELPTYQFHLFTPCGLVRSGNFFKGGKNPDGLSRELKSHMAGSYLLISLDGITSPTVVSLFFQMDSTASGHNGICQWEYMDESCEWFPLGIGNVLKDSTLSLSRSGIVYLRIPKKAVLMDGDLPLGQVQIRAFLSESQGKIGVKKICTQAVEVEYNPNSQGVMTAGEILPANSIKKTESTILGVKKVTQPYDGEVGKSDESIDIFKCRVSERLRHKGRAWSGWDYERIVLEKFPQIAAVKCLRYTNYEDLAIQPGHVVLLVIPDHRYLSSEDSDRFSPQLDESLQCKVMDEIKQVASPFLKIDVHSPKYVSVKVEAHLELKEGYIDTVYYKTFIENELVRYLAPWSDNGSDAFFSKKKTEYDIAFFLENIECVDHVEMTDLKLHYYEEQGTGKESSSKSVEQLMEDPRVIFTSYKEHEIEIYSSK